MFQFKKSKKCYEMLWNVCQKLSFWIWGYNWYDWSYQSCRLKIWNWWSKDGQPVSPIAHQFDAVQSWAVAGGGIQRTFTSLHGPPTFWRVVAWPHAATACRMRFWWNGDPRDEAVCIQITQRPIYINKYQINYIPHLQPASSLEPILDLDLQLLRYKWFANVCRVSARAMFFSVLLDTKGSGHVEHRSNPLTVQIESNSHCWQFMATYTIYAPVQMCQ